MLNTAPAAIDPLTPKTTAPAPGTTAPSTYETHHGFHVLRVSGDDYEMGYQHGTHLKEAVQRGPVPYFSRYVQQMLSASGGPVVGAVLSAILGRTVGRRIAKGFPESTGRAFDGLADGAGIDRAALRRAATMPESYLWVLNRVMKLRDPRIAPRHGVPLLGCTSAIAWGDATRNSTLLHGRNFDYQGVGAWDTEPAIVFHRPKDGQPFVSVGAAGVVFGGVTSMNASGLSLVVHQHMGAEELRLDRTPIGITGEAIMRHAKNLDDAQRILDADRPNGSWTYLIASAHEEDVLCYELSPTRKAPTRIAGATDLNGSRRTFGYANIFLDRDLAARELELYPSHWRNCTARYHRANAMLDAHHGDIDANTIASILGAPGDGGCRFENSISMLMTVASVVFEPGSGIVYAGKGRAPTSNREFVAFDLNREGPALDCPTLVGGRIADAAAHQAFEHYRDAYQAYFDDGDRASARTLLHCATALQPNEALYHFMAGLLALLDRDTDSAESSISRAIDIGHSAPERLATFHLWRGRARDVAGRRRDACADYRLATGMPGGRGGGDANVQKAAERGLNRPYRSRRFGVEFSLADVPMP